MNSIERSKSFGGNNIDYYKFKDQTSQNSGADDSNLANSELHQQEEMLDNKNTKRVNSLRQKRQDRVKNHQTDPDSSSQNMPSVFLKVKYSINPRQKFIHKNERFPKRIHNLGKTNMTTDLPIIKQSSHYLTSIYLNRK